jgi:ribosome biogenesis GTPase
MDSTLAERPQHDRTTVAEVGPFEAMVAGIERGAISVLDGTTLETITLELTSGSRDGLAVGDRVLLARAAGQLRIVERLPRTSELVRLRADRTGRSASGRREAVLAANVETAVVVASVASPAFHPRLVDRYLILCQYGGVAPLLCLNKCDLGGTPPDLSIYEGLDVPVVRCSTRTGAGLGELRSHLQGKTSVVTGHSGVGKSSLVNALSGEHALAIGSVRPSDGRGRHTTSSSTLTRIDAGTYVIDTPGIRSLGLWQVDAASLRFYFPEFERFEAECHFRDCSHSHEPRCAVKAAVESGEIPRVRHASYLRMLDD